MPRENYRAVAPEATRKLGELSTLMHNSSLEAGLVHLVYLRVSQLNGCAYCVDTHTAEALEAGEKPQRLYNLTVWREAPFFTPRERAALAWAEAMTRLPEGHPPASVKEEARAVQREGIRRPDFRDRRDQRAQPHRRGLRGAAAKPRLSLNRAAPRGCAGAGRGRSRARGGDRRP